MAASWSEGLTPVHSGLIGAGYCNLHRADLHLALTDAVTKSDPDAIALDHRFDYLDRTGTRLSPISRTAPPSKLRPPGRIGRVGHDQHGGEPGQVDDVQHTPGQHAGAGRQQGGAGPQHRTGRRPGHKQPGWPAVFGAVAARGRQPQHGQHREQHRRCDGERRPPRPAGLRQEGAHGGEHQDLQQERAAGASVVVAVQLMMQAAVGPSDPHQREHRSELAESGPGQVMAAGTPPRVVTFGEVAPVAMMLGSAELLRAWVLTTLAGLATDDEHHARLRDTLLAFLQSGGSYKAAAELMMLHKNTVQYRIGKAEESLGRSAGENRHDVELALRVSHWLGSSVLQPGAASAAARR